MAGHYLKNRNYKKIDEWISDILSSEKKCGFNDIDWCWLTIPRDLWIPVTEEIYDYIVSKKEKENLDIDIKIELTLNETYESMEPPSSVSLVDLNELSPPTIHVSVGKVGKNFFQDFRRVKILHPFKKKFKTYYWEFSEFDHENETTGEDVYCYHRYVMLH